MTALRRGTVAVYGIGAAVLLVVGVVEARNLNLLGGFPFADDRALSGLLRDLWWLWFQQQAALVVLPALAAASAYELWIRTGPTRRPPRLAVTAPWLWLIGTLLVTVLPIWVTSTGGWFAYAPNSGIVFTPAHSGPAWDKVGLVLAWVALAVTAAACTVSFRRRPPEPDRRHGGPARALAATQVAVLAIAPVAVALLLSQLATEPRWWGRT